MREKPVPRKDREDWLGVRRASKPQKSHPAGPWPLAPPIRAIGATPLRQRGEGCSWRQARRRPSAFRFVRTGAVVRGAPCSSKDRTAGRAGGSPACTDSFVRRPDSFALPRRPPSSLEGIFENKRQNESVSTARVPIRSCFGPDPFVLPENGEIWGHLPINPQKFPRKDVCFDHLPPKYPLQVRTNRENKARMNRESKHE